MDALPLDELKIRFARRFLAKDKKDAILIVRDLFPRDSDAMPIINAAREWVDDPIVLAEIKRLEEIPVEKSKITQEVLVIARNSFVDAKDRIAAYKLAAELNGLIVPSSVSAKGGAKSTDKLAELKAMLDEE
jgi:hypothetical protein